ncbi:MAG: hypothetical protein IGS50_15010 [Synechococcales cyanobacterium C42_A2020_086]|nr:hypothetical protein [Synechococcales cyanobacterium C42_A2020_086]
MFNLHSSLRWSALVGSCLGLIVPGAGLAVPSPLNPCPGIYYEEPFNSTRIVPPGCPANAATQRIGASDGAMPSPEAVSPGAPTAPTGSVPVQPPLPETQQPISAIVTPMDGVVTVRLVNATNTVVMYQVLGETQQRMLEASSEATLQRLPLPVNMTFVRPDGGFVTVTPQAGAAGTLDVTLNEAANFDVSRSALNIQNDGSVILN